uniref:Uncharacterized protein n=1 Tax=Triticum urartu TaxID=4572 RepID=A0A8R7PZE2_TRIUA
MSAWSRRVRYLTRCARRNGDCARTMRYHSGSSSRKTVTPPGLSACQSGESWPSPNTSSRSGARWRSTARESEISACDCCGTVGVVA